MTTTHCLSKAKACRMAGLSRKALYRPKVNWLEKDHAVVDALNAIVAKRTRWGFWKCYERMRLDGLPYNHNLAFRELRLPHP
jgi:putative transposase